MSELTPFQTIGPYFEVLLRSRLACRQRGPDTKGEPIAIDGVLYDGHGRPIDDGLIETWQADAHGRYRDPARGHSASESFCGYGWSPTDESGRFHFETIKPGPVAGPHGRPQAPHIQVSVLARGILTRYITRLYFEDEAANETDPILDLVPARRRATLVARRVGPGAYRSDIRLQGADETVFFDA